MSIIARARGSGGVAALRPATLTFNLAHMQPVSADYSYRRPFSNYPNQRRVVMGAVTTIPAFISPMGGGGDRGQGGSDNLGGAVGAGNLAATGGGTVASPPAGLGNVLAGLGRGLQVAGGFASIVPGVGIAGKLAALAGQLLQVVAHPSTTPPSAIPAGIPTAAKGGGILGSTSADPLEHTAQSGALGRAVQGGIMTGVAPAQGQINAALAEDINASLTSGPFGSFGVGSVAVGGSYNPEGTPAATAMDSPTANTDIQAVSDQSGVQAIAGVDVNAGQIGGVDLNAGVAGTDASGVSGSGGSTDSGATDAGGGVDNSGAGGADMGAGGTDGGGGGALV